MDVTQKTKDALASMLESGSWKINVIFGALKHYRVKFWTYQEIRDINEYYRKTLERVNRFPVMRVNLFRGKGDPKSRKNEAQKMVGNSFFLDVGTDPLFLTDVILGIQRHTEVLEEIVLQGYSFLGSSVNADTYYREMVHPLVDEKLAGYFEYDSRNPKLLHNTTLVKDYSEGNRIIEEAKKERASELKIKEYEEEAAKRQAEYDAFLEKIPVLREILERTKPKDSDGFDWHGRVLHFKEKGELSLSEESRKILKESLKGISAMELDTAINLVENYKSFVEEYQQEQFYHELIQLIKKTQFDLFGYQTVSGVEALIRKYYCYAVFKYGDDVPEIKKERLEVTKRVMASLDQIKKEDLPWLLYFIDILGYLYTKGFCYLDADAYRKINAVMLSGVWPINPYQPPYGWYCFDPNYNRGQWTDYYYSEQGLTDKEEEDIFVGLTSILKKELRITSSLIESAMELAFVKREANFCCKKGEEGEGFLWLCGRIKEFKKDIKSCKKYF